ncbi:hormogonium polysaccharide secretion pseudopilin HpsC [Planktothrix agardhii]|uniref:hormogonium polysaccharide secretion pseudopilin HpsC n=1 Tax=Planktothrix agardhii TaxID=1160 RepID=UPI001D099F09|nr:hormogonium polysaccharide secretion pseudopilin HpsC [Planktothrix agardhii]MCB8788401.1 hormogonium polysaccharide secretion pseudopilin HpsC [Planktothrix agardhii 1025]MCF3578214.1 hormogonium polysaccharide secretion pseudopilin HpsC [Planktothrix agardhii 1812]MCF3609821.1 hormogonium polysaccharide secretion pseudopilin HpsC [Planktothrix agardhii 1027]MCF3643426.1 hormogonium polysaccharide secretion pseudopilin HpsC [Planktothrix agardhii 1026]
MKTSLLILCQNRLKQKSLLQHQKTSGFTMIELLIGMVMAAVIITPILAFVVDVLQSDRKEGVKAATDQELEAATDFIKRDLSQAIYIYNKTGVDKIKSQLPLDATGEEPILIFWKQDFIPDVIPPLSEYEGTVGPAKDYCDQSKDPPPPNPCDDAQVYSLVAYYLNTDNVKDQKWSTQARITRLQIRDGVKDPNQDFQDYIKNIPEAQKDNGFKPLEFTGSGTLEDKMNNWTSEGATKITQTKQVLVDYIDKSHGTALDSTYCQQVLGSADVADAQMIGTNNGGFFACVDSKRTIAQVNIRGNALVKIQPGATYDPTKPAYFPQKNVIVQGRGSVGQ